MVQVHFLVCVFSLLLKLPAFQLFARFRVCVTCVGMSTTRNIYGGCGAPPAWGSGCGLSIRPREVNGVADVRSYPSHSWYSAAECSLAKGSQKYGNAEIMDRPYEYPSEEDMTCESDRPYEFLDPDGSVLYDNAEILEEDMTCQPCDGMVSIGVHKRWPENLQSNEGMDPSMMEMRDYEGEGLWGWCLACDNWILGQHVPSKRHTRNAAWY